MSNKDEICLGTNKALKWMQDRIDISRSFSLWIAQDCGTLNLYLKGYTNTDQRRKSFFVPKNLIVYVISIHETFKKKQSHSLPFLKTMAYLGLKYFKESRSFILNRKMSKRVRSGRLRYLKKMTSSSTDFSELASELYDKLPKNKQLPLQDKPIYSQRKK